MRKLNQLVVSLLFSLPLMSFAASSNIDYAKQTQIIGLQQQALNALSQGNNLKQNESKIFLGVTIKGNIDKAQAALQLAVDLSAERQDLRYSLASIEVMNGKLDLAQKNYALLAKQTPLSLEALTFQAGYASVIGESQLAQSNQDKLSKLSMPLAKNYLQALRIAESAFNVQPQLNVRQVIDTSPHVVIVVLGYALHSDGTMDEKLIQRLKFAFATLHQYPAAKIIVSGGVAQGGVTEAYLMRHWLIQQGVNSSQVILEDKSIDTVSNALNSLAIVQNLNQIDHLIVVSSGSHIRRAVAVFEQASVNLNLAIKIDNQAVWDWGDVKIFPAATQTEKSLIMRDTLRTAGLWAMPGVLR